MGYNELVILFIVSFIAGVLTALAPCVLPLLPVIVGGSIAGGTRRRTYTITISLGVSVILFTLLLKASTVFINIPQSAWQLISGGILIMFGVFMVFPHMWDRFSFVNVLNRSSNKLLATGYRQNSLWGDALMGAALGPVFSSCSPTYFVILATVLPASFAMGFADLFAYAVGLSGALLVIALVGQRLVDTLGITIEPGGWFRRILGALFVVVGLSVATGTMAKTEVWLLNHGFDLSFIERRLLGAPASQIPNNATNTSTFLSPEAKEGTFTKAPELAGIEGYINTNGQSITLAQLKGEKVVLIDIWTYSCINCQRTLPYLRAWYEKYRGQGLEIIGVHTPEFAFERLLPNVQKAVELFGLRYPVVLDNTFATWNAFGNQYWPRKYLIDIDGFIVYDHAGEGEYEETEKAIQRALEERAARLPAGRQVSDAITVASTSAPTGVVEVHRDQLGSPEIYFGAWRNEYLGNGVQRQTGQQALKIPRSLQQNVLYLGGTWDITDEYATNLSPGAHIKFVYKAKNVYFVASAPQADVKIKVTHDGGQLLGSARGAHVNENGEATISQDGLYHLVGDIEYGVHTLEIEVQGIGLEAYTFTFG